MAFQLENKRNLLDSAFIAAVALPAASASVHTASFNLDQSFSTSEKYAVQVDIDPLANFGTASTLTVVIQDSADNVTFANISELGSTTVNANTTVTTSDQYRLPPTARQYIRALAVAGAINGNIASNNVTLSLRF